MKQCSFCYKSESDVRKLVSSPSDYPRAYICDECIRVCASILEDHLGPVEVEQNPQPPPAARAELPPESPLSHPMASELLTFVDQWISREASGHDASDELSQVRNAAQLMFVNRDA